MSIEIYAHRGGSGYFAENTLAAFSRAIDQGCAGAELDVHLTRDGVVVVHHDARLNPAFCRKLDGSYISQEERARLADMSLADLGQFNVGVPNPQLRTAQEWPHLQPAHGQMIPTLDEVILLAKRKSHTFRLLIEIKTDLHATGRPWQPLVDKVLQRVQQHGFEQRVEVCSFNWQTLAYVRRCNPDIALWFTLHPLSWYGRDGVPAGDIPPSAKYLQRFRQAWAGGAPWLDGFKPDTPDQLPQAVEQAGGDVVFAYHADVERLQTGLELGLWSVNAPFTDLQPYQKARYMCLDYPFLDAPGG